jgi:hypothetical protein
MRDPTTEEILAKTPETIEKTTIPTKNVGGRPKLHGHDKHKWYSEEDRIEAATVYAVTGKAVEVERITGIPAYVVRKWKTLEWWPQIIERIRQEKDDELDSKFTKIVDKTVEVINERLENGDYVYDNKSGEVIRKPIDGKSAAIITSIFVDKRELLRRKESHNTEQASIKDRLERIAQDVRKLASGAKIIDGEVIEKTVELEIIDAEEQESIPPTDEARPGQEVLNT